MLMNADSLYTAAHYALLLNLKLSHGDYYRKRPTLAPGMMVSVSSGMGFPQDELPLCSGVSGLEGETGQCVLCPVALQYPCLCRSEEWRG